MILKEIDMKTKRINGLDIFRGMAILSMMIYHFTYDLNYFGFIAVDMNHTLNFLIPRYLIMSMFLLSVGMSLILAHQDGIRWSGIPKRILQLGLASLAVSITTYVVFPNSWAYFGILHFILFASIIVLPLLNFPQTTLILALLILLASATKLIDMHSLFSLLQAPLHLPQYSEDLVPFVPWIAVVLLGMSLVQYNYHTKIFSSKIFNSNFSINKILKKMGQNSLIIYLIHQPIFFVGFALYFIIFSK